MYAIVDCNSFYCSCERLFRPDLQKKPVVVLSNNDGCIVSRTDEAKAAGIGMAAPYYQYRELIREKEIAVFSSNYNLYGDLSMRVMDTLREMVGSEKVEVYSVDEAFLSLHHIPPNQLTSFASRIKEVVEQWTGIQVSVGVAPTKVLAKLANRLSKKNKAASAGVWVLDTEERIIDGLDRTPIADLWGIGSRYAIKLREEYCLETALQLRNMPEDWAKNQLGGVVGLRLIRELKGFPSVQLRDPLEKKKMIATTRMFGKPVYKIDDLKEAVATYTSRAAEKLRRQSCAAQAIDVFVVSNVHQPGDYQYAPKTRYASATLDTASCQTEVLIQHALPLVEQLYTDGIRYLKTGVTLRGLVPQDSVQFNMFEESTDDRGRRLMEAMDNINFSQRDDVLKFASTGLKKNWKMRQELRSARFTTRWDELYDIH